MSDTLTQEEIDALREVVKSGAEIEQKEEPAEASDKVKVVEYDFKKPRLIGPDQLHVIEMLHEGYGKAVHALLVTSLKATIEVKLAAIDQLSYGEFVLAMANPTHAVKVAVEKHGAMVMELGMPIPMVLIDLLLGGDGKVPSDAARELTVLERGVLESVVRGLIGLLRDTWAAIGELSMETGETSSNPEYIQLTEPETPCLGLAFDVHFESMSGVINICYPISLVQAIFKMRESKEQKPEHAGQTGMLKALADVPLQTRIVLGNIVLSAAELGRLQKGDVVCMDKPVDTPVDVRLHDMRVFTAQMGKRRDKLAVEVLGYVGSDQKRI